MIHQPTWQAADECSFAPDRRGIDIWRIRSSSDSLRDQARCARDELLRRYLGMAQPHLLPIGRGRRGKPFLATGQGPFDFNLSHTGELALLAVSRHGSVGIDIERVRPVRDPLRIATRVWPDDLVARLASRPRNDRLRAFFLGWTRFEACQKALGRGVFDPPVDPSGLQTSTFSPTPGYVACLAVVAAGFPPLHYFDFMPQ